MKLSELNPKLTMTGFLVFDCPCGKCGGRIRIALEPSKDARGQSWTHTGYFPQSLTLLPSVNAEHSHFWIRSGNIEGA